MIGSDGIRDLRSRVNRILVLIAVLLLTLYYAGAPFIQSSLTADLNGDGTDELILIVWKYGSYGKHRPSWVEKDDAGLTQHVFIYQKKRDEKWHPIWMSSQTGLRIRNAQKGPVIKGADRDSIVFTSRDGAVTSWGWLTWGLTRLE